nr:early nodulin-like protein 1 [Ipomoea batatas]
MAQNTSSTPLYGIILGSLSVLLLIQRGCASYTFKVGGAGDWAVPSDPNTNTYNQWAEKTRFQIGDTLMFMYPADKDSVLLVTKDDFTNCNTQAPLEKYSDGHTVFSFNHSGAFYFISGVQDNCKKNQKVVVVVMADRSGRSSAPSPSPSEQQVLPPSPPPAGEEAAPSPAEASPPAPTTSSEVPFPSPSSAPAGEEAPPPPDNSTPAPSQESNPPKKGNGNAASSTFTATVSSIGALIGSSIILAF